MKVVSFNINGLRARFAQMEALVAKHNPDIIGLQEVKVHSDQYPAEFMADEYKVFHFGQKSHYGVAIYTKYEPEAVHYGFPWDEPEAQRRLITIDINHPEHGKLRVINGYFPQGESIHHETKFPNKRKFYADLNRFIEETPKDYKLIVMGDFNICPLDLDIGIGPQNAKRWLSSGKCSFQPEEREMMGKLLSHDLVDSFRVLYPEAKDFYSWFDYRSQGILDNRGLRIDLILCSSALAPKVKESLIDLEIRTMEKPSDHAPVLTEFA